MASDLTSTTLVPSSAADRGLSVHVRPAGPDDAHTLAVLGAQTFLDSHIHDAAPEDLEWYLSIHFDVSQIEHELAGRDTRYLLGYLDDGRWPSGFAKLRSVEPSLGGEVSMAVELQRIYVSEADSGLGVGGGLMRRSLVDYMNWGYDAMYLGVDRFNLHAQGFYERFGFSVTGERNFAIGNTLRRQLMMQRSLRYGT